MRGNLNLEIRNQLVRYLAGEIPLREFRNWFHAATWNAERLGDPVLMQLVGEIGLRLAEFSNDHWTEDELRAKLMPLVRVYVQQEQYGEESAYSFRTSSQNQFVSATVTLSETGHPDSPAGIKSSLVYG